MTHSSFRFWSQRRGTGVLGCSDKYQASGGDDGTGAVCGSGELLALGQRFDESERNLPGKVTGVRIYRDQTTPWWSEARQVGHGAAVRIFDRRVETEPCGGPLRTYSTKPSGFPGVYLGFFCNHPVVGLSFVARKIYPSLRIGGCAAPVHAAVAGENMPGLVVSALGMIRPRSVRTGVVRLPFVVPVLAGLGMLRRGVRRGDDIVPW